MSVVAPAGNGTITRMVRLGNPCARPMFGASTAAPASAAPASTSRRVTDPFERIVALPILCVVDQSHHRRIAARIASGFRQNPACQPCGKAADQEDRKSTRLNSSHLGISYAVFCLKK